MVLFSEFLSGIKLSVVDIESWLYEFLQNSNPFYKPGTSLDSFLVNSLGELNKREFCDTTLSDSRI